MQTTTTPKRRLCAHADDDGRGMHYLAPGERCPDAPASKVSIPDPGGVQKTCHVYVSPASPDFEGGTIAAAICVDAGNEYIDLSGEQASKVGARLIDLADQLTLVSPEGLAVLEEGATALGTTLAEVAEARGFDAADLTRYEARRLGFDLGSRKAGR
jgi:hypothetical protein